MPTRVESGDAARPGEPAIETLTAALGAPEPASGLMRADVAQVGKDRPLRRSEGPLLGIEDRGRIGQLSDGVEHAETLAEEHPAEGTEHDQEDEREAAPDR